MLGSDRVFVGLDPGCDPPSIIMWFFNQQGKLQKLENHDHEEVNMETPGSDEAEKFEETRPDEERGTALSDDESQGAEETSGGEQSAEETASEPAGDGSGEESGGEEASAGGG